MASHWTDEEIIKIKEWLVDHDQFDRIRYYRYMDNYYKTNNLYELYYHILFNLGSIGDMFPMDEYHPGVQDCKTIEDVINIWFNRVLRGNFEEITVEEI